MNSLLRNLKPKDTNRQASSIPPSMQFWLCGISLQVAMVTLIIEMWLWVRSWSKCPWNLWKMFIWEQSKQNNTARTPTQNLCRQTEEQRDGKVRAPPPPHTHRQSRTMSVNEAWIPTSTWSRRLSHHTHRQLLLYIIICHNDAFSSIRRVEFYMNNIISIYVLYTLVFVMYLICLPEPAGCSQDFQLWH